MRLLIEVSETWTYAFDLMDFLFEDLRIGTLWFLCNLKPRESIELFTDFQERAEEQAHCPGELCAAPVSCPFVSLVCPALRLDTAGNLSVGIHCAFC